MSYGWYVYISSMIGGQLDLQMGWPNIHRFRKCHSIEYRCFCAVLCLLPPACVAMLVLHTFQIHSYFELVRSCCQTGKIRLQKCHFIGDLSLRATIQKFTNFRVLWQWILASDYVWSKVGTRMSLGDDCKVRFCYYIAASCCNTIQQVFTDACVLLQSLFVSF